MLGMWPTGAIAEFRRDDDEALLARLHQLQDLVPAGDHREAVDPEGKRVCGIHLLVEGRAVEQAPDVIHVDQVAGLGPLAGARLLDDVADPGVGLLRLRPVLPDEVEVVRGEFLVLGPEEDREHQEAKEGKQAKVTHGRFGDQSPIRSETGIAVKVKTTQPHRWPADVRRSLGGGGMLRDQAEGPAQEGDARLHAVPGGGARGVRQRDAVGRVAAVVDGEPPADDLAQRRGRQELGDRELADGQHEGGLQEDKFALEPAGAGGDFIGGSGTRSPPSGRLPGKQRQTAAKYTRSRTSSSVQSRPAWNQRKSVLPAVQAKGRPSLGSLSPGAWPTSSTRLATGRPTTTGRCIRGQRSHARRASRWVSTADFTTGGKQPLRFLPVKKGAGLSTGLGRHRDHRARHRRRDPSRRGRDSRPVAGRRGRHRRRAPRAGSGGR